MSRFASGSGQNKEVFHDVGLERHDAGKRDAGVFERIQPDKEVFHDVG
jgi:hypothetical protein